MDVREMIENGREHFLPNQSVDIVIIGYEEGKLKCLLLQIGDKWVLPGGFIGRDESVDDATIRVLRSRTGLQDAHLKFLSVFGGKDRSFDKEFQQFFQEKGFTWKEDLWIFERFVTLAYYSLVDIKNTHPTPGEFDDAVAWHDFEELPAMWLDHKHIVLTARERLKQDIKRELITHNLLPAPFTMPQLHQLHEVILNENFDRSRFQKKMLASGLFERLPLLERDTPGRKPYQYKIKEDQ